MGNPITLHHKEFEGLAFGPNNEIQFGSRAGQLPGFAVVDEDEPMLAILLAQDPNVEVVTGDTIARVYVSPIEPGREFKSRVGLMSHIHAAARKGDEFAKQWLERFGGNPFEEADPSAAAAPDGSPPDDGGVHRSHDGVVMQDAVSPPVRPA